MVSKEQMRRRRFSMQKNIKEKKSPMTILYGNVYFIIIFMNKFIKVLTIHYK